MRVQVDELRLENMQTGAVIDISSNPASHYLASRIDWGAVEGTHHNYSYVGQIGTYVTGTTIAGRELEIEAYVCGRTANELSVYKRRLNQFFNPLYDIRMVYDDYFLKFKPLTSVKYQREWEDNNTVFCKWLVQGYAEDPMWGDAKEGIARGSSVMPGTFRFPLVIGTQDQQGYPPVEGRKAVLSYIAPSKTIVIVNSGSIEIGARIVFTARATVVRPSIWHVQTQEYMKINKTLQSGETVEINTNDGQKIVRGKLDTDTEYSNYYRYKDIGSSWLKLYPGSNVLRFTADDGEDDMEVVVYYYNKYVEVEVAHE